MTEKRFYLDENGINDREYEFSVLGEDELVNIINELNDENNELKKRLTHAEKVNTGLIDENHRLRLTLIHSSDLNFDIDWLKENLNKWSVKE